MTHFVKLAGAIFMMQIVFTIHSWACSDKTDCTVPNGIYRILENESAFGTLIFAHGYKGSSAAIMSGTLRSFSQSQNLNLVALEAAGDDWAIDNAPTDGHFVPRNEIAYVNHVISDLEIRFGIERSTLVFAGFSAGGMLVSTVACKSELVLHAYVAIAGTAWKPLPLSCSNNNTPFLHIHGSKDKTVPMIGRPIADSHQGDVRQFLRTLARDRSGEIKTIFRKSGACTRPSQSNRESVFLCLTMDGHSFQPTDLLDFLPTRSN